MNNFVVTVYETEDAIVAFLQSQEEVKFLKDSMKASKRSVDLHFELIQKRTKKKGEKQ